MALAQNLKRIRALRGLSQTRLAKAAGMSQQSISRLEKGTDLTTKMLPNLARALGVGVHELDPSYEIPHILPEDDDVHTDVPHVTSVPLLDSVAAGKLTHPSSQIPVEEVPLLAFADLGRGEFFALKVQGDSMDRISPDGSVIVIDRADQRLINGKYYVFAKRGETTFKMWRSGFLIPYSLNPTHEPMSLKEKGFTVVGRVKRTVLDL